MNDPYEKVWEEIRKGFDLNIKMIKWIAERTMSVKDYKEFIDEFTEKHDNHDELLDFLRKKRSVKWNENQGNCFEVWRIV